MLAKCVSRLNRRGNQKDLNGLAKNESEFLAKCRRVASDHSARQREPSHDAVLAHVVGPASGRAAVHSTLPTTRLKRMLCETSALLTGVNPFFELGLAQDSQQAPAIIINSCGRAAMERGLALSRIATRRHVS